MRTIIIVGLEIQLNAFFGAILLLDYLNYNSILGILIHLDFALGYKSVVFSM